MTSNEWIETSLGDEVELITGFPFKSDRFTEERDSVRLLRGDNVGQGALRWNGAKRWPSDSAADFDAYLLRERDVIVAMDRPWIEAGLKYASVRHGDLPCLLVQRVARLRARAGLDQAFLSALVASPAFTAHILSVQTGTAVPHVSADQIAAFRFLKPPLGEQRRIAGVLGTLDDKIEHNRRTAARLDALAALLFTSALSTEDGGWTEVNVNDVATVNELSHSTRSHPSEIEYVHISTVAPREILATFRLSFAEAPSRARRVVRAGDTIVSTVRPERRAMAFVPQASDCLTASTGFAVVSPGDVAPTFLYRVVTSDACIEHLASSASGSAYPAVNPDVLGNWHFKMPPDGGKGYEAVTRPIEDLRWLLLEENRRLAAVRETLLPKLLSGAIRVPESYGPDDSLGAATEGAGVVLS